MDSYEKTVGKVPAKRADGCLPQTEMARKTIVPILYRHAESGLIEPIESAYAGRVPECVWKNVNRQLLKLDAGRYFYPLDAMDAYAEAVNKVEVAAESIACGEVVLNRASPVTYLTGVAHKTFYRFHLRKVQPLRELYRQVGRKVTGRGTVGEDGFDSDNYDATQNAPSEKMCGAFKVSPDAETVGSSAMTIQQLAESLPGLPWAQERRDRAASALEEIYAAMTGTAGDCAQSAVKAFRAYVKAECDMVQAARIAGISKTDFYRKWPAWIKFARKVGKNRTCRGTN